MGNVLILDSVIFSVLLHCWPSLILLPATFDLNSLRNSYFTQTLAVFFFFFNYRHPIFLLQNNSGTFGGLARNP